MVNKETIIKTIAKLSVTYPSALKDISKEQMALMVEVWYEDFKYYEENIFIKTIEIIRSKCKFFPSIAEIKEELANNKIEDLKTNSQKEWDLVLKAIRNGYHLKDVYFIETTRKTIQSIGYTKLEELETDKTTFVKREFIEVWENYANDIKCDYINNINENCIEYNNMKKLDNLKKELIKGDFNE